LSHSPWRYGLAALIVAWLIDLFFWQTPPGVSFFLWTIFVLAAGFMLARLESIRPSPWSYPVAATSVMLSSFIFLRTDFMTRSLSFILTIGSLALLAATFRTGNWVAYRTWDYIPAFLKLAVAALIRPAELFKTPLTPDGTPAPNRESLRRGSRSLGRVLVGLLLALPLLAIFGALLSSADPIFSNSLSAFLSGFNLNRLGEYIFRLFYILIFAFIFSGVYLHAVRPSKEETRPDPSKQWLAPFLGWIEAGVVLGLVDLMFAFFVGIQFWYFFGGQANISTSGYTFAEYARRGFFELLAVAVISLLTYLGLATVTRRETTFQRRGFTVLSIFLMAMVMVMLVSAFQRLLLYESAYGFTQLRVYIHIFILWLGLLLAAVILFELFQRRQYFGLALLLAVLGFALTLGFFNTEGEIAHQNIARARAGATEVAGDSGIPRSLTLDATYLNGLDSDAVPALVDEFRRPGQLAAIHDILGAELACRTADIASAQSLVVSDWRSFNLSQYTADTLLAQARGEWSAYIVTFKTQGLYVTVNGVPQLCIQSPAID
jgi:Domain of unknown function (DUF4173)